MYKLGTDSTCSQNPNWSVARWGSSSTTAPRAGLSLLSGNILVFIFKMSRCSCSTTTPWPTAFPSSGRGIRSQHPGPIPMMLRNWCSSWRQPWVSGQGEGLSTCRRQSWPHMPRLSSREWLSDYGILSSQGWVKFLYLALAFIVLLLCLWRNISHTVLKQAFESTLSMLTSKFTLIKFSSS